LNASVYLPLTWTLALCDPVSGQYTLLSAENTSAVGMELPVPALLEVAQAQLADIVD